MTGARSQPTLPYAETRGLLDATHQGLLAWAAARLAEAGYAEVPVVDGAAEAEADGPRVALLPYRMAPWPRRIENTSDLPLTRTSDRQAGVPARWSEVGQLIDEAFDVLMPEVVGAAFPTPPRLGALPKPLRDWYGRMGQAWLMGEGPDALARVPVLLWRPAFLVRSWYLALAEVPPGSPASVQPTSLLGVLALAVNWERSLDLELPGPAVPVELRRLMQALARVSSPELRGRIKEAITSLEGPARWSHTLVPFPDLDREDLAGLMRALRRPLQPSIHLALQIPLGAGPLLQPSAGPPRIHTRRRGRG